MLNACKKIILLTETGSQVIVKHESPADDKTGNSISKWKMHAIRINNWK